VRSHPFDIITDERRELLLFVCGLVRDQPGGSKRLADLLALEAVDEAPQ
jgi:hypothetical protein